MNWKNIILGVIFSFFGAISFGEAPYVIAGYGLATFCLLVIAYTMDANEAYIAFIVGNSLGLVLDWYTQSLLLLVIIGAGIFRIVQAIVLIELKKRYNLIASSLISIITLTIVATLIGMFFYGGEGLMTSMTLFDVFYIFPAYLVYYIKNSGIEAPHKLIGYVLTISATITVFLSISTFFLPIPFIVGLVLLTVFVLAIWKANLSSIKIKPVQSYIVSVVIVIVFAVTFLISGPAAQYAVTTNLYPIMPSSLTVSQWQQTNPSSNCRQGNTAGAGTEENGVWSPPRLRVISTCQTVTGIVELIYNDTGAWIDGDFSFDIRPDPSYSYLMSFGSYVLENATIHVEVVPSDQATVLSGLNLHAGEHVSVTGVWLLDTNHGWYSEIHPAWNITQI